ncbi:hypothetical protein AC578_6357 [Pseudocercospora eumusae]|uniref:Uncharacterized protein n=1 Tax=Pseudocercospora eumusae TaxID=321146 RepID=A0A139HGN0_9PEZI|nr:hypothetical protein AC578_6357 [Pseudocercospora eumusae]
MASLLARLGQLGTRKAVQTIWTDGTRKRGDWVCAGCKATRALRQRRDYSDGDLKIPEQYFGGEREVSERDTDNGTAQNGASNGSLRGFAPMNAGEGDEDAQDTEQSLEAEKQIQSFGVDGYVRPSPAVREMGRTSRRKTFISQQQPSVKVLHGSSEQEQLALWEQFERVDEVQAEAEAAPDQSALGNLTGLTTPEDELLNLDYKQEFPAALAKQEADLVIRCLFSAYRADDMDFIQAIPETTFTEVIRILEPSRFVSKLGNAHIELSAALVESMAIASMRTVAYDYSLILRRIMKKRRSTGTKPTLEDYRMLLRAFRDLGGPKAKSQIWNELHEDGYTPDLACWNYYMASHLWKGAHNPGARHKVRVIPFNMLARSELPPQRVRLARFSNYAVGPGGIRDTMLKMFNQMLANGILADEESFRILITACAREGDVDTVKSILRKVWRIDVDGIMQGKNEEDITPRHYAATSSLRPSPHLLFTLAHCFGINNDIPTALRVIDFVARHYKLPITMETWSQLFEWTFVLSLKRAEVKEGPYKAADTGSLPINSPEKLWETMTGAPYFVQPTLGMYNMFVKSRFRHRTVEGVVERMKEALNLVDEQREQTRQAQAHLNELVAKKASGQELYHESVEQARNDWENLEIIRRRNVFWARRWIRLLLGTYLHGYQWDHHFTRSAELLPALLWDYRYWAPRVVSYETPSGLVEFELRQKEEVEWRTARWERHREAEIALVGSTRRYLGNDWIIDNEARHVRIAKARKARSLSKEKKKQEHDIASSSHSYFFHSPLALLLLVYLYRWQAIITDFQLDGAMTTVWDFEGDGARDTPMPGTTIPRTTSSAGSRLSAPEPVDTLMHRKPSRSNTVTTYHESDVHDASSWQPGAEPGVDTSAEDDKIPPHLIKLKTECNINNIHESRCTNADLEAILNIPRTEKLPCRWISVNGLSWDVIRLLGNKYNLHRLAIEDLIHTKTRTKVDWYAEQAYIVLTFQKLVRLHQHRGRNDKCTCTSGMNSSDEEEIDEKFEALGKKKSFLQHLRDKLGLGPSAPRNTLPQYMDRDHDGKVDEFVSAHSGISEESPVKAIRTLHRYESAQIPEHTAWMERHSALAQDDLAVSVEQVSIFLLSDNSVISFFEHSADDVERPILNRLNSPETMLRRSCDASLLLQAIIDAVVDLATPVRDAYNKSRKELQIDAMTNPNIKTSRALHIFGEEVDMLQNLFKPIVHLVNSLRDHNSEPSPGLVSAPMPSVEHHRPKSPGSKRNREGVPAVIRQVTDFRRIAMKRADYATSVTITPLAHTYFGDVLDHCITMIQALEQMDASAGNISTLIFNTVGAQTNNFMMILAVVTVFFAPLTFISGYFGMNFSSGSGLAHTFAFFWIIAMPILVAFMLLVFGFMLWDKIRDFLARRGVKARWHKRTTRRRGGRR